MTLGIISKGCVFEKRTLIGIIKSFFRKKIYFQKFEFCGINIITAKIEGKKNLAAKFKKAAAGLDKKADLIGVDKLFAECAKNFISPEKLCLEKEESTKEIFLKLSAEIYLHLAAEQKTKPQKLSVLFEDAKLKAVNADFLKSFCLYASAVGIKTESQKLEDLSEELFCETGCCLQRVCDTSENFDVEISADGLWIRFLKKAFVCNFEFGFEEICKSAELEWLWLCFLLNKCEKSPKLAKISGRCAVFEF